MRKGTLLSLLIIFLVASGCSDTRYSAEKLFWQAEQRVGQIIKAEEGKLSDNDYQSVIDEYRKVVDAYPLETFAAKAQFSIANIYVFWGKPQEAQKELKKVIQNFHSNNQVASRAQYAIGRIFESQGQHQQALLEYEKVMELYPMSYLGLEMPIYIMRYYRGLHDDQNYERAYRRAVRHYQQIINDYTDTSVAPAFKDYLALTYIENKEWEKAMEVWDIIIAQHPGTQEAARAYLSKAELYATQIKDIPASIGIYEEFLKDYADSPGMKQIKYRLANLYFANEQIDEAKDMFASLLEKYPQDKNLGIRSHFFFVECLKKQGESEQAIKEYQAIKEKYAGSPGVYSIPFLIYQEYKRMGQEKKAEEVLTQAIAEYEKEFQELKDDDDILAVSRMLFFSYTAKKDWDKYLRLLKALEQKYPGDPGYPLSIASFYRHQLDKPEKAKEIYEKVIDRYSYNESVVKAATQEMESLTKDMLEQKLKEQPQEEQ